MSIYGKIIDENYNMISTEKLQNYQHNHQVYTSPDVYTL